MRKKLIGCILFILLVPTLVSCKSEADTLIKVKGEGLTYNENFKLYDKLDQRTDITYYKAETMDDMLKQSPNLIKEVGQSFNETNWPLTINKKEGYLIKSENSAGETYDQIQLSFLNISEFDKVEEFIIVSIYEVDKNPFASNTIDNELDFAGNKLVKSTLDKNTPIYQQILDSNKAMLYKYYGYNEKDKTVGINHTAANEIYTYHDGYIYNIGYLITSTDNSIHSEMLELIKKSILNEQ